MAVEDSFESNIMKTVTDLSIKTLTKYFFDRGAITCHISFNVG